MPNQVDTSIYGNVFRPQQPNLLGMGQQAVDIAGGMAQLQNALNQNAQFQQQFKARSAMGPIMQRAIDPTTGQIDFSKAALMMSANPDVAWMVPDFVDKSIARQSTQMDIFKKQLETSQMQQRTFSDEALGLLTQHGTGVTQQQVIAGLGKLVSAGTITANQATAYAAQLPKDGPGLANFLKGQAAAFGSRADTMEQVLGKIQTVDLGGSQQVFRASPLTGEVKQLGQFEKTPTPAELNAPTEVLDPEGRGKKMIPRFQVAPMVGGMGTVTSNPVAQGGTTPQGQNPLAPIGQAPLTAYPKEKESYLEGVGKKMNEYEDTLNTLVSDNNRLIVNLDNAWRAAQKFKAGGGSGVYKAFAEALQSIPGVPDRLIDTVAKGHLPSMQEFEKIMVPAATQAMRQAFGGVQRFALMEWQKFQDSQPNIKTDPRAIENMFNIMKRVAQLSQLEQEEFNNYKKLNDKDPGQFPLNRFPAYWQDKLVDSGVIDYAPYKRAKGGGGGEEKGEKETIPLDEANKRLATGKMPIPDKAGKVDLEQLNEQLLRSGKIRPDQNPLLRGNR